MTEIVHEYTIFHSLETIRLRRVLGRWPLHVTIIPPFVVPDDNLPIVRDIMRHISDLHAPISVSFSANVRQFSDGTNPISVLMITEGQHGLGSLHNDLLDMLTNEAEIRLKSDQYVRDRYMPHVSLGQEADRPESTMIHTMCMGRRALGSDIPAKTIISSAALRG